MGKYDVTQTNAAVRDLLGVTENPKHRFLLQAYDRHRNLEMAGRYKEIFEPDLTVGHPVYHFDVLGMKLTLDGREAVEAVYREWTETDQCVFYAEDEKLAVGDNMIVSSIVSDAAGSRQGACRGRDRRRRGCDLPLQGVHVHDLAL